MLQTPTLHLLCGKAGAGKTTLAQRLADAHGAMLLSEDIWLWRLFGDRMKTFDDYIDVSRKLKTVVGPLAVDLLRSGRSVVMDFPANTKAWRAWLRSLSEQAGSAHVLHVVPTPDAVCLERIAQRNVERPEGSHHLTVEDFDHVSSFYEAPDESEGFVVKVDGGGQQSPLPAPADAAFFEALETERTQALVSRDMPTVERLHAPDYQLVTPAGQAFDRATYLGRIAAAPFYAAWQLADVRVRQGPAMALVRYRARLQFPSGRALACWHTDSYEPRAGRWQAVWSQATELRAATPAT